MESKYYQLLGVQVNLLDMNQLNSLIVKAVKHQTKWIIANHNLNSLYIYHHNSQMRAFYNQANYIHIDGMALVLLGKLLGIPCQRKHRVTYADWVWSLMEKAVEQDWRILYLGAKPGVADKGAEILQNQYPNLQIDTIHGYFNPAPDNSENQIVLDKINFYQPHVLMVGMGMPRQEQWILDNIDRINTNVILPSGACIDYVAGAIKTPPRWMGKIGLEWLYRLITEPNRLWKRYLIEPWFIAWLFLKELFYGKHYATLD
ncbi:MAG: WecB/TagA/CpsF family glycosyltransferase, partial [Pleurocapsa sp.]